MPRVALKPGHVQPVWAGHPWVYAQAIARIEGSTTPGDEVDVVDPRGNLLGRGLYSPGSAIPVRLYTRRAGISFDRALLSARLDAARDRRGAAGLPAPGTTGYRLVHAEGDALPGLVVDRFDDVLVVQLGTVGLKRREDLILETLVRATGARAVVDRTSVATARVERFEAGSGVIRGDRDVSELAFEERRLAYRIPLELKQKTGFYFDQRPLRARIERLAAGRRVLDAFCYVGSMALTAARGGAREVLAIDNSALAVEVGADLAARNELSGKIGFARADAREELTRVARRGGCDLVICDPPKLAPSRAAKKRALAHMAKLAELAAQATTPGGVLALCSCSAVVSVADLARALALGCREVGLRAVILDRVFQGADHPVPAAFPEGLYLSTLIAQITRT
jgi:23S rRNA (cytosine1962-C5)-methyltransferase